MYSVPRPGRWMAWWWWLSGETNSMIYRLTGEQLSASFFEQACTGLSDLIISEKEREGKHLVFVETLQCSASLR